MKGGRSKLMGTKKPLSKALVLKSRVYSMERELAGLLKRRIPRLQKELRGARTRAAELKREIRATLAQVGTK